MERHKIAADMWVPAPIEKVWEYASNPQNLVPMSPPIYKVQVAADAKTENGATFRVAIQPVGVGPTVEWIAAITDVKADGTRRQFIDLQTHGPFSLWKHTHIFESGANEVDGHRSQSKVRTQRPGTWIRDRVEYALPYGTLGRLAHDFVIRKKLEHMFVFRHAHLREIFG